MNHVVRVLESHPLIPRKGTRFDALLSSFDGGYPVDAKVLEAAVDDGAIHSTHAARVMWSKGSDAAKLAVLAWKAVASKREMFQLKGQSKGDAFNSLTLVLFGLCVCSMLQTSLVACLGESRSSWLLKGIAYISAA